MPWSIERRDGAYCVVKQGESNPVPGGCHDTRGAAIKHQRALYASESRVASVYQELDARPDPEPEPVPEPFVGAPKSQIIQLPPQSIQLELAPDQALTAALAAIHERQGQTDSALSMVASAIQSIADKPPPEPPQVTVAAPEIHVAAPEVTVQPPEIKVEVAAPEVTVRPTIKMPAADQKAGRQVSFERDNTGRITGATVEES